MSDTGASVSDTGASVSSRTLPIERETSQEPSVRSRSSMETSSKRARKRPLLLIPGRALSVRVFGSTLPGAAHQTPRVPPLTLYPGQSVRSSRSRQGSLTRGPPTSRVYTGSRRRHRSPFTETQGPGPYWCTPAWPPRYCKVARDQRPEPNLASTGRPSRFRRGLPLPC